MEKDAVPIKTTQFKANELQFGIHQKETVTVFPEDTFMNVLEVKYKKYF